MEEEFYIPKSEITFSMKVVRFYFHRVGWIAPNYTARLFWRLFTKPRFRELTKAQLLFLEKANSDTLVSKFYSASYTVHRFGTGKKKVLLCHGWEGRTVDFRGVIDDLIGDDSIQVISIDFPGHGTSPQSQAHLPMFIDVINSFVELEDDIEVFVGHSLGAASIAMAIPENHTFFDDKQLILMGLHPIPSQFIDQYKSVTRIGDALFEKCLKEAERTIKRPLTNYNCHDHAELYAKSSVLLVHDSDDKIIKVNRLQQLSSEIKSSSLFTGKHGGHFRHFKHPDVIREIKSFIRQK